MGLVYKVLLGAIPFEGMDLIADPAGQAVIGAHYEKAVFRV
jgi:hypothetical protein